MWLFLALGTGEVEQNIFRAVENAATRAAFFHSNAMGFFFFQNRVEPVGNVFYVSLLLVMLIISLI